MTWVPESETAWGQLVVIRRDGVLATVLRCTGGGTVLGTTRPKASSEPVELPAATEDRRNERRGDRSRAGPGPQAGLGLGGGARLRGRNAVPVQRANRIDHAAAAVLATQEAAFRFAEELRQSSDDLIRMARAYAATGDGRYLEYFREIVEIRNGGAARPRDYVHQFFLHTETVPRLGWLEGKLLNTPSAHRVHHGSNSAYIDKNYGGAFIIWDRLFGTYQDEIEPVKYGVTTGFVGHNPFTIQLGPLWKYLSGTWKREKVIDEGRRATGAD